MKPDSLTILKFPTKLHEIVNISFSNTHTQKNFSKKKEKKKKHISKHIPHTPLPCNCKMID